MSAIYYTTSRSELYIKPCPFCGSVDTSYTKTVGVTRVVCNKCNCYGPLSEIIDPRDGDSIIAWNQRMNLEKSEFDGELL